MGIFKGAVGFLKKEIELNKKYYESLGKHEDAELSFSDKETIMTQRVTTEDMLQFTSMPYQLNCQIKKHIQSGSHPFAYMDLDEFNQSVAKKELLRLGEYIKKDISFSPRFSLDVSKIEFEEYDSRYGYTRLMCTPHTFTGKISKFPLSLFFMSRMDIHSFQELGNVFYLKDGNIGKAEIYIWRRKSLSKPGEGRGFHFKIVDGNLALYKSEYL